ncbi:MAG: 16S rRNA (adenine(1518)-N(6)/adenine(1519)-N(6))-dimethyltransferase RsmA [Candidatus Loosdrechtia sp.]|uniref:ribosomal RNA small subunit methyltransferase A n=1 Tax=Candidatus Loosdrechtia sp. TaxID=3101272 RepID=UPI003A6A5970|nr:MAG: 16S rRNA (adenine(1518)-N(6)/adenine(1519)-N(6))-dimethyltransferase RsmA [Candidatus Jettenia sp. AMX2]
MCFFSRRRPNLRTMSSEQKSVIPHTPSILKQIFNSRGIILSKRFGQNFLVDQNTLLSIPEIGDLKEDDVVLEIGTGTGGLTRLLAERARYVFTVEVDKKLFELSSDILRFYKNITLINADILKTKHTLNREVLSIVENWLREHNQDSIKVISNLPYNISTPVIINLLESNLPIKLMILMLQREITERMVAIPGTREYGILSVIVQLFSDTEIIKTLPPEVFWPRPEVHSAIVWIHVNKEKYAGRISNYPFFRKILYAIFTSRRKTLINSLEQLKLPGTSREQIKKLMKDMNLEEKIRGEMLKLEEFIVLSETIYKMIKQDSP